MNSTFNSKTFKNNKLIVYCLACDCVSFPLQYGQLNNRRMDFEEFCAAAISPYQLEALKMEKWQKISSEAFRYFEKEGNRVIGIDELAKVWPAVDELTHNQTMV